MVWCGVVWGWDVLCVCWRVWQKKERPERSSCADTHSSPNYTHFTFTYRICKQHTLIRYTTNSTHTQQQANTDQHSFNTRKDGELQCDVRGEESGGWTYELIGEVKRRRDKTMSQGEDKGGKREEGKGKRREEEKCVWFVVVVSQV